MSICIRCKKEFEPSTPKAKICLECKHLGGEDGVMNPVSEYKNYIERECLAFDEKIALARLEESKAAERVRELEYQKARFCPDAYNELQKLMHAMVYKQEQEPPDEKQQI